MSAAAGRDPLPPSTPFGVAITSSSHTGLSLTWSPSSDNVGVVGYGVYVNGVAVGTVSAVAVGTTSWHGHTLRGLACGSSYSFAVDAYDAGGNRSRRSGVTGSTAPCPQQPKAATPAPPVEGASPSTPSGLAALPAGPAAAQGTAHNETPSSAFGPEAVRVRHTEHSRPVRHTSGSRPDLLPPSSLLGLAIRNARVASVSLAWSTASDNVAVAGYGVYTNGVSVGSTTSTRYTISGLVCATTYTFAVDVYDAAGNRSAPIQLSGSTAPCPTGRSGNLFVAPATASPAGSDANPCSQTAPCLTFGRAYRVAAPGQIVQIASGTYPAQRVDFDPSKGGGEAVTFQPAPGANVDVNQIDFGQTQLDVAPPRAVVVRDMYVRYIRAWNGARDLVWQNIRGTSFAVIGGDNVSILGGSFGPCKAPRESICTPLLVGTNLLVDGASIHDQTLDPATDAHVDGMFIRGCQNCTVRNSRFWGNDITNIRVQNCCGNIPNQNLTLENNWFAAPSTGNGVGVRADAVDLDTPLSGLLVRNNSFSEKAGVFFGGNWVGTGGRLVGNLMMNFPCVAGITYSYNLFIPFNPNGWGATPCSATDRKVPGFGYANGPGFDYGITAGSPAVGAGDPTDCPGDDIDGQARAGRCDAGSDQL